MFVCYTGGGTLGHVWPALAVHRVLLHQDAYRALWIGRDDEAERQIVEDEGIPFVPIASGKLRRSPSLRNLGDGFRVIHGFFQARSILASDRPDVLFSKGGYVSVPPVVAAHSLGIPVVTHESDTSPGLATRIDARYAGRICVGYAEAGRIFDADRVVVTGNPLRPDLLDEPVRSVRKSFSIPEDLPLLFVMGGSQGAQEINDLVVSNLDVLCSRAFVFHQMGRLYDPSLQHERYFACSSATEWMASLYRESTMVVSRGGAGSIGELAAFALPALVLPLHRASRGDQVENARLLADRGAALLCEGPVDGKVFVDSVLGLLENSEKRSILSGNIRMFATIDAAERIAMVLAEMTD